jgi:hypothetical protein
MRKSFSFIIIFLSFVAAINGDFVTINYYSTPVKVLPHDNAYKLGSAQKGDSFKVIQKEGDWYHIQYNNLPAWVHSRYVVESAQPASDEKEARAAVSPEPSAALRPSQEKPVLQPPKPIEPFPQQYVPKKNADPAQPKKGPGKNQPKQPRDAVEPTTGPAQTDSLPAGIRLDAGKTTRTESPGARNASETLSWGKKSPGFKFPLLPIILALAAVAGVLLFIVFALKGLKRPPPIPERELKNGPSRSGMDALIIAKSKITIFNSLTDSSVTIPDFLSEMGFKVHFASDLSNARTYLLHYIPDVIIVDWKLEPNIQNAIASIVSGSGSSVNIAVVFYNVPNPASIPNEAGANMQAHFLGMTLSDQDISRIVVPLFRFNKREKRFKESVQATALEGEIQKGNLAEVLQFIEMGRKTGCLYIVVDSPFGLVYFEQGRILYAVSPAEKGEKAVIRMLDLEKGYFHFVMNKITSNRNCNNSCLEIVAEWARIQDEADRRKGNPGNNKSNGKK